MIRVFEQATEHIRRGEPCALVTVVRTSGSVPRHAGAKMLVNAQGAIVEGTIGGGEMENRALQLAKQAIADGQSRTATYHLADLQRGDPGVCGGTVEVFIEPLLPAPTLLVVGAGHVGRALVHLAKWCGFRVVLNDDRTELCTPDQCPGADLYLPGPLVDQFDRLPLTAHTYVAMVTRGYPIDVAAAASAPLTGALHRRHRQRATLGSGRPGPPRTGHQRIRPTARARAHRYRNSRRNARGDRRQHHGPGHPGVARGTLA